MIAAPTSVHVIYSHRHYGDVRVHRSQNLASRNPISAPNFPPRPSFTNNFPLLTAPAGCVPRFPSTLTSLIKYIYSFFHFSHIFLYFCPSSFSAIYVRGTLTHTHTHTPADNATVRQHPHLANKQIHCQCHSPPPTVTPLDADETASSLVFPFRFPLFSLRCDIPFSIPA